MKRWRSVAVRTMRAVARGADVGETKIVLMVLPVAILAVFGLVVDGGGVMQKKMDARWAAQSAGRNAVQYGQNVQGFTEGALTVDPYAAVEVAKEYLAASGFEGTVKMLDEETIQITVMGSYDPIFWPGTVDIQATAQVSLVEGP